MKKLLSLQELKIKKKDIVQIVEEINKNNYWGYEESWEYFILGMSFLSPQSYGAKIQNRLVNQLMLEKVRPGENKGDFKDQFGEYYEFKVSILSNNDSKINLVQIRPWQDINHYCFVFDIRNEEFTPYAFRLSKSQMKEELDIMKATAAHGTKDSNNNNKNIEYRMSISPNPENEHFKRWIEKYKTNFDFTKIANTEIKQKLKLVK